MNIENLNRLIDHYNNLADVPNWSGLHCVAGVIREWHPDIYRRSFGVTTCMIEEYLDVSYNMARRISYMENTPAITLIHRFVQIPTAEVRKKVVVDFLMELAKHPETVVWQIPSN